MNVCADLRPRPILHDLNRSICVAQIDGLEFLAMFVLALLVCVLDHDRGMRGHYHLQIKLPAFTLKNLQKINLRGWKQTSISLINQ